MREWIVGRNSVYEVLRARHRQVYLVQIAEGVQEKGRLSDILRLCTEREIPVKRVPRSKVEKHGSGHQGVAVQASGYPYSSLVEILSLAAKREEPPFILILDTLQDPQNLGVLIRTAEVIGVHGIVIPHRRTVSVTPTVVSASSGASEHLQIAQYNIAQAITILKENNIWVIGLDSVARTEISKNIPLDGAIALVVGGEGEGMRALVRKSCDFLVRLPMRGKIESLNAAAAGSIVLYLTWQARGFNIPIEKKLE